jgi:hypothetical protein
MSILDRLGTLSDAQALTSTAASEDVIDLGVGEDAFGTALTDPDLAEGRQIFVNVQVGTVLDSSGQAATLTVALQDSADNSSWSAVYSTAAIAEATLVEGYRILSMGLPVGLRRYIRLYYTVGTESFTSGNVSAWLGLEPIPVV